MAVPINYQLLTVLKNKPLAAYSNIFKLRANMALKRQTIYNYPIEAFIEPTLYCHLRCPGCPTGRRLGLRPRVAIELDLFRAIIDRIGSYIFRLQMYNWGEPFLHKNLPEMIRYAKEKGIEIILSSNLNVKFSDDYIEQLIRSGVDRLIVSLDGTSAETYEKYRRGGNFELVRSNMLRIQAAKRRLGTPTPRIVWQFLVFRHNEHEIAEAMSEYEAWGADMINVFGAQMPYEPFDREFEPSRLPRYNIYHPLHPNRRATEQQLKGEGTCTWLYGVFVMNPNGSVSPCCSVPSENLDFSFFSLDDNFMDVWNSNKFKRARGLFAISSWKRPDRGPTAEDYKSISRRIDGMAARLALSLNEEQIICQKCPIPWRQNQAKELINEIGYILVVSFFKSPLRNIRCLLSYLLMGATDLQSIIRFVSIKIAGIFNRYLGQNTD